MIPIYRAKKIGSDEYVEGALIANAFFKRETKEPCCYIFDNSKMDYDCFVDIAEQLDDYEIDPSTLAMSFNGGVTWRTLKEVHNGLSFLGEPIVTGIQQ